MIIFVKRNTGIDLNIRIFNIGSFIYIKIGYDSTTGGFKLFIK